MEFTDGSDTTIRYKTQITHITQNNTPHSKHSTENYTSNKGHTTQMNTMQIRFTTTMCIYFNWFLIKFGTQFSPCPPKKMVLTIVTDGSVKMANST
jgi:hypothetical protein